MATAKLTLIGLDHYTDGAIWSGLSLPSYFNKEEVINNILLNFGEFGVLYPNPDAMTTFITIWSKKYQRFFARLAAAMQEEYLPLANYDRHEEWTDKSKGTTTGSGTITDDTRTTDDSTTTGKVSAYNESGFQNRDQQITDAAGTSKSTNKQNTKSDMTGEGTHTGHVWGNIGVKTTQSILLEEIRVSAISPYDLIAELFSNEFLIKIYV